MSVSLDRLAEIAKKRYGDGRFMAGLDELREMRKTYADFPRLMSGIFPLDYAIGGGVPTNVPVQFYGPPDSGKSTVSYLLARSLANTCMNPGCLKPLYLCRCENPLIQKTFIAQFEGASLDPLWLQTLGCEVSDDNIYIATPDYAEQGCEMIEAAIQADDCGLIIVDSVGAMIPRAELECSYEDMKVGNQAKLLTRFIKRTSGLLVNELRRGHLVCMVLINQIRSNIGGGFNAPTETTAGGYALRHGVRLSARFTQQKPERNKEDSMKNVIKITASLLMPGSKQQVLVLGGKAEFQIVVGPVEGVLPGTVMDWRTVIKYGKGIGAITGDSNKGYRIEGIDEVFPTQNAIIEAFKERREDGIDNAIRYQVVSALKQAAIDRLCQTGATIIEAKPASEDDDGEEM